MPDLVTPKCTLLSLTEGLLHCLCPSSPKYGCCLLAYGRYQGSNKGVSSPSVNHESYCSAHHLISAMGSWGPRKKSPVPLSPILPRPDQEGSHLEVPADIGWVLRSPSNSDILQFPLPLQYAHWSLAKGAMGFPRFCGWGF